MGKLTGWKCDRGACGEQVESNNGVPRDWYTVSIKDGALHYCSDYCHAVTAVERYEALSGRTFSRSRQTGKTSTRVSTPATVASARKASNVNWHNKGKHDGTPRADCPLCDANKGVTVLRETRCFS